MTHEAVPCTDPVFGRWNPATDCYEMVEKPQPPTSDPVWAGHRTGVIVWATCPGTPGSGGGDFWAPRAPGAVAVSPEELARRAVRQLPIRGPVIRMVPRLGRTGLVGLPVWMWTPRTTATWGPVSRTAAVPGTSVTGTAHAVKVAWAMGDGHMVICRTPGTAYRSVYGDRVSPDCGYRYTTSSAGKPHAVFRVVATTTWQVTWAGGGASGALTVHRSSSSTARVGEMQVLIQPS